jgi:hypothetical protein
MALGLTQPLTKMNTRNIFWPEGEGGKTGRCVGLTTLPPTYAELVAKTSWKPQCLSSLVYECTKRGKVKLIDDNNCTSRHFRSGTYEISGRWIFVEQTAKCSLGEKFLGNCASLIQLCRWHLLHIAAHDDDDINNNYYLFILLFSLALQPSAGYGLLWLCSPARAMASSGCAAQRGLWPPVAVQPSAGYGLLWLCSPARAMASCGSAAQRGLWPPRS